MQVYLKTNVNQSTQAFKARFDNNPETKKELKILAEIYNPHEVVFANEILNRTTPKDVFSVTYNPKKPNIFKIVNETSGRRTNADRFEFSKVISKMYLSDGKQVGEYLPYWGGVNGIKKMTMIPDEVADKLNELPQINKINEQIGNINKRKNELENEIYKLNDEKLYLFV